jgi:hypothetical protein
MAQTFLHSSNGLTVGTSETLLFGPVGTGITAIVFSGTFTNIDSTNKLMHYLTLQKYDGTTYNNELFAIPIPYGSASKCPKIVLNAGESLYATADVAAMIAVSVSVLELS